MTNVPTTEERRAARAARAEAIARDMAVMAEAGLQVAKEYAAANGVANSRSLAARAQAAARLAKLSMPVLTRQGRRKAYPIDLLRRCVPQVQMELTL